MEYLKKISCSISSMLLVIGIVLFGCLATQIVNDVPEYVINERLVLGTDGNNNYSNNWGVTPTAISIGDEKRWQDKSVQFEYKGTIPSGNRIVMEAESAITESLGGWDFGSTLEGYCGDGYLFYTGENKSNTDLELPLVYKFNIVEAGTYIIIFRGRRDKCESCDCDAKGDGCNDIWASLDDSKKEKKLVKHYWSKWGWGWPRMTAGKVPYRIHLDVGMHVLKIGGRSKGVKLDQIAVVPESEGKPKIDDCL